MTAVFASFLGAVVKFLFFLAIAWGGIMCGKKYRDHKDSISTTDVTK